MISTTMRILAVCLALALSSCASVRTAPWTYEDTRVTEGSPVDVAAIVSQSRAFSAAYVAGDVDALVAIYASDGIAAPSGRDFLRGPEALRAFWSPREGQQVTRHQAVPEELRISGDLAYDWGYYEGESGPVGQAPQFFRGKYLIVWQRDADGLWRIANDMWNTLSQN